LGVFGALRTEDILDEIVLAMTSLASKKVGAILVLEREMGLKSYIETGIALDAQITYDLLINVFTPGTPLHDGAVIIQGKRLAGAACFLPLTVNPELSRTLGSRHRAAIGITEDTDAVAVVVSEETGTISMVVGGRIRRGLDATALRQALFESMEMDQDAQATPAGKGAPANAREGR
jgi:diadenylate cyclase